MPNWCMNNVSITGDADTIAEIVTAAEENRLLEYLNPIGEWDYGKAVDAWGTKWDVQGSDADVCIMDEEFHQHQVNLNFDTAWSPPTEALRVAADRLSIQVESYFFEPGLTFVGYFNSEEDEEESYQYDFEDENWRDEIPEFLVEYWNLDDEYENWVEWNLEDGEME